MHNRLRRGGVGGADISAGVRAETNLDRNGWWRFQRVLQCHFFGRFNDWMHAENFENWRRDRHGANQLDGGGQLDVVRKIFGGVLVALGLGTFGAIVFTFLYLAFLAGRAGVG